MERQKSPKGRVDGQEHLLRDRKAESKDMANQKAGLDPEAGRAERKGSVKGSQHRLALMHERGSGPKQKHVSSCIPY